jgi:hypothetical protein
LLEHVRRHRGELVRAALTILRAFILAEKPEPDPILTPMDFAAWSALVRNAVHWATGHDPAIGREDLSDTDSDRLNCVAFVEGWYEVQSAKDINGMTSADLVRTLKEEVDQDHPRFRTIRDAIANIWPKLKTGDLPSAGQIGMKAQAIRGKWFGKKMLKAITSEDGRKVWAVIMAESTESNEPLSRHGAREPHRQMSGQEIGTDGKVPPQTQQTHSDDPDDYAEQERAAIQAEDD